MVDLWVKDGIVDQIMVHDSYRGKLMDKIGLGSTIADIERHIGAWEEDEEDNLVNSPKTSIAGGIFGQEKLCYNMPACLE